MPKVWPNLSLSLNDIQDMINSALEMQAKSIDELLCRLIKERDGKKHNDANANPSSSTCAVNFAQTNPHTRDPSVGGTTMPNPSAQPMNHFHSRTIIEGSASNLGMPQQTTTNMYEQVYTHTIPSFTIPNPSSTPYTSRFNGRAYPNPSSNFQAPYTTVDYIDPIPLPGSSLGFLPNRAYQTLPRFNAFGHPKAGGFGYETLPQFPFRPQPVDMTPVQTTAEPVADPNNLTNHFPYPRGYRVPECSRFSGYDGKTTL
jgi:hypothetical protein